MKKVFVKTNNVKRFITMMNNLQNRPEGVPAMGLVYELFAILYSDIDFENKTVLINKFVKNGKIQKYNKRHKIRTLNLP